MSYPSSATQLEAFLRDPTNWRLVLREIGTRSRVNEPEYYYHLRVYLLDRLQDAHEATWSALWATGFVIAAIQLITDEYFCGYTKEELSQVEQISGYELRILWLAQVFDNCLRILYSTLDTSPQPVQQALDTLAGNFPRIWRDLWEVRTPFLDCEVSCKPPSTSSGVTLHFAIMKCIEGVEHVFRQHRPNSVASHKLQYRIPHLRLLIWALSNDKAARTKSLSSLLSTLRPGVLRSGETTYSSLYRDAIAGSPGSARISDALLRGLNDRTVLNADLYNLLEATYNFRLERDHEAVKLQTERDRRVLWGVLAAGRRHLCSSDSTWEQFAEPFLSVFTYLTGVLFVDNKPETINENVYFPETQVYGIIALIAKRLLVMVDGENPATGSPGYLIWPIKRCAQLLAEYNASRPPRVQRTIIFTRKHTYNLWQSTVIEIRDKQLLQNANSWMPAFDPWIGLRRVLADQAWGPVDLGKSPFHPLERCRWEDCLCFVHRPAHPLRACRGCWQVAYCNVKCQRSDWKKHRQQCRGRTVGNLS